MCIVVVDAVCSMTSRVSDLGGMVSLLMCFALTRQCSEVTMLHVFPLHSSQSLWTPHHCQQCDGPDMAMAQCYRKFVLKAAYGLMQIACTTVQLACTLESPCR